MTRSEHLDRLRASLAELPAALAAAGAPQAPATGEWSLDELLAHLADAELMYGTRLRLLHSLADSEWGRTGTHTERGVESVEDQLVRMSEHDAGHLRQLQELT